MNDLAERLEDLLKRLSIDLSPTGLRMEAGVYHLARSRWVAGRRPDPPMGFGEEGYVLVLDGRQHLLPTEQDGAPDALEIIGDVQEWAIDELGYGWPELCDVVGNFLGLLTATRDGSGLYVWAVRGHPRAMVGDLASLRITLPSASG